jgi:hypothetical protein
MVRGTSFATSLKASPTAAADAKQGCAKGLPATSIEIVGEAFTMTLKALWRHDGRHGVASNAFLS